MFNWSIFGIIVAGTIVISVIAVTLLIRSNLARRRPPAKWDWWHDEKYFDLPVKYVIIGRNGHPNIEVRHWTDVPEFFTARDSEWSQELRKEREVK